MDDLRARLTCALAQDTGPSSDFDLNRDDHTSPPDLRGAGVLVAIEPEARALILTKRASHLSQHPGQIAFPGGKIEPHDGSAEAAALREAREEIGLPEDRVEILGRLPTHETVTGYRMTPVIAFVTAPFPERPEPGEVAEIFRVPLAHVADPARYIVHGRQWRGRVRRYYAVPYGPYYIWGATARILRGLAQRMAE